MKKKLSLLIICICAFQFLKLASAQQQVSKSSTPTMYGDVEIPNNAIKGFKFIKEVSDGFKMRHEGRYPENPSEFQGSLLSKNATKEEVLMWQKSLGMLINPDAKLSDDPVIQKSASYASSYTFLWKRPNGETFISPRQSGSKDINAYTDIYIKHQMGVSKSDGKVVESFAGNYYFSDTDGVIRSAPADETYFYFREGKGFFRAFPGQAGLPFDTLTPAEMSSVIEGKLEHTLYKPEASKDTYVIDNGGPESLVYFSRSIEFPNPMGIDRRKIWDVFDPSKSEFSLEDIQVGAKKLGLSMQVTQMTLDDLEKSGGSALLFLKDDGRIVTLVAIDADRAVVMDRGFSYNVSRSILSRRYSGSALTSIRSNLQRANLYTKDVVRSVQLPSLDAEVPQTFTLRNTGKTPITLQLEYPLLGVTESKLSKDTLAPDETATLDLKVKWRSILNAPTQNVLVSLRTNDPIVPRLQLAVLLNPPQGANK